MPEFYVIIARKKIFFTNFWGYMPLPVSYAYVDMQYKQHYAAQKGIT